MRFHSSYIIQFSLLFALFLGLTACSGDNAEPSLSTSERLDIPSLNYEINGTSSKDNSIAVTANCKWDVTLDVTWIHITSATGFEGSGTIVYSADENPLSVERIGHLIINTTGGLQKTIEIKQQKGGIILETNVEKIDFLYSGGDKSLIVTSNTNWTVSSSDDSWLKINGKKEYSAEGTQTLTIHAERNTSAQARPDATITFTWTDNGEKTKTLKVTSGGNTPSLIATSSQSISAQKGTGTITVLANYQWTAVITEGAAWSRFKKNNMSILPLSDEPNGDPQVEEIEIDDNDTNSERTLKVKIQLTSSSGASLTEEVIITQEVGTLPVVSIPSAYRVDKNTVRLEFTKSSSSFPITECGIKYSTDRDAVIRSTGVKYNSSSDNTDVQMTINTLQPDKTYYICAYATNKRGTTHSDIITYENNTNISLQANPSSLFFSSNGGNQYLTVISSNTEWKAYSSATWLKIDGTNELSGKGNKQLTIHADKNTETNDQKATITIVAEEDHNLSKSVEVTLGSTTAQLSATSSSEPVSAQGGAGKIYVQSNFDWTATISGDVSWARFKNGNKTFNGGANGSAEEVEITMDENTTGSARTLTIEVKNDANLTKTVTLQQNSSTTKPGRDDNKVPDNPQ